MLKIPSFCLGTLLLLASCIDRKPTILPEENAFKVFPSYFKQNVLVENIVSESVGQTVDNSFFVTQLQQKYPDGLIFANFHKQDWLETPYTNDLITMLGGFSSYPRAAINRIPSTDENTNENNISFIKPYNWEYHIEKALQKEATVSIGLETSIQPQQLGSIKIHIAHKKALSADMRIGLYMIEDNIQSIFQVESNDNYKHQHVMKNSLFDIAGDTIDLSTDNVDGEILSREYNEIELKFYHLENLHLVAFIYNYDVDFRKMRIYNVAKVKFAGVQFWNQ